MADDGDLDEYLQLFTDDAVCEGAAGFGRREGHADILAEARERRAAGTSGPGTHTRPTLTSIEVQVDGEGASRKSCFLYYTAAAASPNPQRMGVFQDEHPRTPKGWKLAHRTIVST